MISKKSLMFVLLIGLLKVDGLSLQSGAAPTADGEPQFRAGEVIVEIRTGTSIEAINARFGTSTLRQLYGTNFYRLRTPNGKKENKWRKRLSRDADVLSASLNSIVTSPSLFGRATFSFPDGYAKPGLTLADFESQTKLFALLNLAEIGSRERGGRAIVAVVDTGIDRNHPALAGRLWTDSRMNADKDGDGIDSDGDGLVDDAHGWDFVDNDNDPSEEPGDPKTTVAGHGTFIAGLILKVAPDASIMPLRAFPAEGIGDAFTVASAVKYAADHGANVINLSLGSSESSDLLQQAILDARSRGITVIAAVGNDNSEADPQFPSTMDEVMAVAAIDLDGHKAAFSNYGLHVDLSAPGDHLISTFPVWSGAQYAEWSGTSFSAPLTAAEAALVVSADPLNKQVRRIIEGSAANIDNLNQGFVGKLGKGRIDPLAALKSLNIGIDARATSDLHSEIILAPGPGFTLAGGKASINVSGDAQEFTVLAQGLSARTEYQLYVNGTQITRSTSASLGSLTFLFGSDSAPLIAPLNPVVGIRNVELRDASNRIVLAGAFSADVSTPTASVQKEAKLASLALSSAASGHSAVTVQAVSDGSRREAIEIAADGLDTGSTYRFLIDGFDAGTITAQSGFARLSLATDGGGAQQLPQQLRPVTNIRRVQVQDGRGQLILQGSFALNPVALAR